MRKLHVTGQCTWCSAPIQTPTAKQRQWSVPGNLHVKRHYRPDHAGEGMSYGEMCHLQEHCAHDRSRHAMHSSSMPTVYGWPQSTFAVQVALGTCSPLSSKSTNSYMSSTPVRSNLCFQTKGVAGCCLPAAEASRCYPPRAMTSPPSPSRRPRMRQQPVLCKTRLTESYNSTLRAVAAPSWNGVPAQPELQTTRVTPAQFPSVQAPVVPIDASFGAPGPTQHAAPACSCSCQSASACGSPPSATAACQWQR